jgi:hypothetical protein
MRKYKHKTIPVLKEVICDMCKESCLSSDLNVFMTIRAVWGWGSIKDGTVWRGDYCEKCADKIKGFIENAGGNIPVISGEENGL